MCRVVVIIALLFAVGAPFVCAADKKKEEEKTTVHIKDLKYTPPTITIKAGQAITWLNDDDKDHTVVADDGSFESDNLGNGEKFKFTFKKKGKFSYHCKYHPREKGVVIVTD